MINLGEIPELNGGFSKGSISDFAGAHDGKLMPVGLFF
jgi:hypothetical protein